MAAKLPKGWIETDIETINCYKSKNIDPRKYPKSTFQLFSVPAFPEKDAELLKGKDIKSTKQFVKTKDILLCKINPRINRVWTVSEKLDYTQIASSEWIVIRNQKLHSEFLTYYFQSPRLRDLLCQDLSGVGGSLTRARPKIVKKLPVPLPPLNEQKRIVARLDQLLARVDSARARLSSAAQLIKNFRQAVLNAAVTGRLTEEWRAKNANFYEGFDLEAHALEINAKHPTSEEFGFTPYIDVPGCWHFPPLCRLGKKFSYGSSKKSSTSGLIPVLRMGNIQENKLFWDDLVYSSDEEEIEKYLLKPGDVLFNRTNSPELVGKSAYYGKGAPKSIYAGYLIKVEPVDSLNPKFLTFCLNSSYGRDYCWAVKTDGVSQSNINAKKLGAFPIPFPIPEEQKEIVKRVEDLFALADSMEAKLKAAQARTENLTAGILAKAFRGELVPQNPNDQPAEELLKEIKALREKEK